MRQNDAKAYAWPVFAGGQRELLDKVTKRLSPEQEGQGRQEVGRLKALLSRTPEQGQGK